MSDGSIVISLAQPFQDLFSLFGHSSPVTALQFVTTRNTGETMLVSGDQEGFMSFWDLNSRTRSKSVKAITKGWRSCLKQ